MWTGKHKCPFQSYRTLPFISRISLGFRLFCFVLAFTSDSNNDKERKLSLQPRLGGLGLKNFVETARIEYDNSCHITFHLKNQLLDKNEEGGKTKYQVQAERKQWQQTKLDNLRAEMNDANVERGVSD